MTSVTLNLEDTPEELQKMQTNDERNAEIWAADEENLKGVFRWLKEDKGVEAILSLTVKDNPNHFCSDDTIEYCLKNLEVRYLNWNRPNMCANRFTLPNSLVEISLYWTGLDVVLWGLSDTEGLRTLNKVGMVETLT